MSTRFVRAASLAAAAFVLAACSDATTSTAPEAVALDPVPFELAHLKQTSCQVTKIFQLVTQLAPLRRDPQFDMSGSVTVALLLKDFQVAIGQRLMLGIAEILARPAVLDKLRDPNGSLPPTKAEAVSQLVNLLFECVGLPQPGDISGAYGPGGAVAVIGPEGGTVISDDEVIAVKIGDEAVNETRLIALAKLFDDKGECLPGSFLKQVVDCYKLSTTPNIPFAAPVRLVMCSFDDHDVSGHDHLRHDRLRIAKTQNAAETQWKVYDKLSDPIGLDCEGKQQHASYGNGVMGQLERFAAAITKPFRPAVAWAADGVGADILEFSRATVVDPVTFGTGFEDGDPEFTTSEGALWHRSTLTGVNTLIGTAPEVVKLAQNDQSGGALPGPLSGAKSLWYGEDATGNYRGAPFQGESHPFILFGGRSAAPNSGSASSPYFRVPITMNTTSLSFKSWFEIESANFELPGLVPNPVPGPLDFMDVTVDVQGGQSGIPVKRINPNVGPSNDPRLPLTAAGFDQAPVVSSIAVDLSAYRGQVIRLNFTFNTVNEFANGFRGWIIDDVAVVIGAESTASPAPIP